MTATYMLWNEIAVHKLIFRGRFGIRESWRRQNPEVSIDLTVHCRATKGSTHVELASVLQIQLHMPLGRYLHDR